MKTETKSCMMSPNLVSDFLPPELLPSEEQFAELWEKHPDEYHEIKLRGQLRLTPRWQQAYGHDYHYTGRVNRALPMDPQLEPLQDWARESIDRRLNGVLVNWYDADFGHYIGPHRDSTVNMVVGSPIVMISFGADRLFRMRPWKGQGYVDFPVRHGSILILPWATNQRWTHEVPHFTRSKGRRISITLRAFNSPA